MKRHIGAVMALSLLFTVVALPAKAESELRKDLIEMKKENQEKRKEMQKEVKEKREELKKEALEKRKELMQDTKEKMKELIGARISGELIAMSGTTLTVLTKEGKTYSVDASKAQLFRKYGAKSELSEFSVRNSADDKKGDLLNVIGKFTDDAKTKIEAKVIRNISIEARRGAFMGIVKRKENGTLTIQLNLKPREEQTVYYDSKTKFVNRKEEAMTIDGVQIDDKVRVKGVWNNRLKKIIEVQQVKDFTQPLQPKTLRLTTTPKPTE